MAPGVDSPSLGIICDFLYKYPHRHRWINGDELKHIIAVSVHVEFLQFVVHCTYATQPLQQNEEIRHE